jgi:predicted acyltransferase
VRAGAWLRERGAVRLLLAGIVALAIGWLWAMAMPINKNLWTSSYVVYAAGWSLLLLALFHWLFDLRGGYPLGRSMGINAITAYAGSWLMACVFEKLGVFAAAYAQAAALLDAGKLASLTVAVVFVAFWWLLMWVMEKQGWRITI